MIICVTARVDLRKRYQLGPGKHRWFRNWGMRSDAHEENELTSYLCSLCMISLCACVRVHLVKKAAKDMSLSERRLEGGWLSWEREPPIIKGEAYAMLPGWLCTCMFVVLECGQMGMCLWGKKGVISRKQERKYVQVIKNSDSSISPIWWNDVLYFKYCFKENAAGVWAHIMKTKQVN